MRFIYNKTIAEKLYMESLTRNSSHPNPLPKPNQAFLRYPINSITQVLCLEEERTIT